jgi:hypothetical protein
LAVPKDKSNDLPHEGVLHGPSPGLRAWADWLIDVRKRWHEGDPPRRAANWRLVLSSGPALLVAAMFIIERMLGG